MRLMVRLGMVGIDSFQNLFPLLESIWGSGTDLFEVSSTFVEIHMC